VTAEPENLLARALVFVPALDEAGSLPATIKELHTALPEANVLVVDDGSTDETAAVARDMGVLVVSHPVTLGAGACAQTAFRYARRRGYEAAVQHDADGQHDSQYISVLLRELAASDADVVIGSRYLMPGGFRASALRRGAIWFFSVITSALAGQRFTDVTSGQRAFNKRAMTRLVDIFPAEFPDAEAILLMKKAGLRIREIPVTMRGRRHGKSKTTAPKALVYSPRSLIALLVEAVRRKYSPD
jgi:glycosyltransferase involved in cell wall biosynthesis